LTKEILEYMILNIDEAGHLDLDFETVAKNYGITLDALEAIRQQLKWFDPTGVGARDIQESLLWQGIKAFPNDELFHLFIENHLQDVANQNWLGIATALDVNASRVETYHERLLSLNPRPISQYSRQTTYLVPDMLIKH